ncbi:MAG: hypothetical protein CSA72_11755 [Rhodobacterales bacterium]|nr:MAG: hypothetical protein CSA72_11755 [Rhodobacterales bacterium]
MIARSAILRDTQSEALYSDCERYRYALTRIWADGPRLTYVMLNPSKATETANDPTIERCERRARALGYGGFRACNLFALRETDPSVMRRAPEPCGPENDTALRKAADWGDAVLCAWGVHGAHLGRGAEVEALLRACGKPLLVLGLTKHGHPRHPLYVSYRCVPAPWRTVP